MRKGKFGTMSDFEEKELDFKIDKANRYLAKELLCDDCGQPVDSSGSSLDIPDENTKDNDICSVCGGPL